MRIIVCVKQVPETDKITTNSKTHTLERDKAASILNPYDSYALEAALQIKEQCSSSDQCHITVITMGPLQVESILRNCLAVGCDEVYLINGKEFAGSDTLATSYILSTFIRYLEQKNQEPFSLIFCGKQAIDGDTAQVGPALAEHLGIGQITNVLNVQTLDSSIVAIKETALGYDKYETNYPCLMTFTKAPRELRYPSIKNKLKAKKAVIETLTPESVSGLLNLDRCGLAGSPTKVKSAARITTEKNTIFLSEKDGLFSSETLFHTINQLLKSEK